MSVVSGPKRRDLFPRLKIGIRYVLLALVPFCFYWSAHSIVQEDVELKNRIQLLMSQGTPQPIPPGTPIPVAFNEFQTGKTLVVFTGSSIGCSTDTLVLTSRMQTILRPQGYRVVLVPRNTPEQMQPFLQDPTHTVQCAILPDAEGRIKAQSGIPALSYLVEYHDGRVVWSRFAGAFLHKTFTARLHELGLDGALPAWQRDTSPEALQLKRIAPDDFCGDR